MTPIPRLASDGRGQAAQWRSLALAREWMLAHQIKVGRASAAQYTAKIARDAWAACVAHALVWMLGGES